MSEYKTIAESRNFIVLDKYTKDWQVNEALCRFQWKLTSQHT